MNGAFERAVSSLQIMANVLIIDDDPLLCDVLSRRIDLLGHEATCVSFLKEGVHQAMTHAFDVVFLDVRLPDGNGLDILPTIQQTPSSPEIIIITGMFDPDGAELAIKSGAWDYIEKPSSTSEMLLPFLRALQYREEKWVKPAVALKREGIVGYSPQMTACLDLLAQAASTDVSVLITGETGTGKELFARAIHNNSARANKNFVVVDCTSLPQGLVESILFGHRKGAFTGADRPMEGLIKQADGGTLFLDEVGELPLSVQKNFLRVLQEHKFRPIGSMQEIESHFRLVAATNRDLEAMVAQGQFRSDLLFRLRSLSIQLPPLKERHQDIKDLVFFHMNKLCEKYGTETKGMAPDFLEAVLAYDWPGNVRELINCLERTLSVAGHAPTLFARHLPPNIRMSLIRSPAPRASKEAESSVEDSPMQDENKQLPLYREFRESLEVQYLQELIDACEGNIVKATEISGLSRTRIYELLKKHGLAISK